MKFPRALALLFQRSAQGGQSRTTSSVVRPMPRREISYSVNTAAVALPRARPPVTFRSGVFSAASRLFVWLWILIRFYAGNLFDVVMRRDSEKRRAARLRRVFESGGPTFAKLGQQLSMRADILPYAYCSELSKMLDQAVPMHPDKAIEIIEHNLGQPLEDVFEIFDPTPIGSASLACVYQARLKSGARVAVKVRRPGIGPLIAADLRAAYWLLIFAETLTIIPPGPSRQFREDFETILFNEMNFRAEARYTDIFRRRAAKRKKDVTAPRVYFDYCTEEVMVSEFVSGVWMWEVLAAVDSNDQQFLARLRQQGIEPKALAKQIVRIMNREVQEELFFHADPHPANLIIMPGNKICFIDFGAIGRFSTQTRKLFRELQYHMQKGDIGRVVNTALALLGPLPPMDVERVRHEMEKIYADAVYAFNSEDAEWWEKTQAHSWRRFLEVARQFSLPASFESLLVFRTSFAYDTIIHRLDSKIDLFKEARAYQAERAREARKRMTVAFKRRLRGPTDLDYLQMEEGTDMLTLFLFQMQRNIENPIVHFRNIVGKIAFIVSVLLKFVYLAGIASVIMLIADRISRHWFGQKMDWSVILDKATTFGWVQLVVIAVVLIIVRRIIVRLSMPDTRLNPDR